MARPAPENTETAAHIDGGISRRVIIQGAAWSLPVVALAAGAPMAAASVGVKSALFLKLGNLDVDAGDAEGAFAPAVTVSSDVPSENWNTGAITVTLTLTGPWLTATITRTDGTPWMEDESFTDGAGIEWTTTEVVSGAEAQVTFRASGVGMPGSTTLYLPEAKYTGTYNQGSYNNAQISTIDPIKASVSFAATAVNSGAPTTGSLQHVGPRTVYTPVPFNAPTWTTDRAEPRDPVITADTYTLTIGSPTHPSTANDGYYRYEGVMAPTNPHITEVQPVPAGVNYLKATLYIDPEWEGINWVTAELWARVAVTPAYWPKVYFTSEGGQPRVQAFAGWADSTHVGPEVAYGDHVTLELAYDPFRNALVGLVDGVEFWTQHGYHFTQLDRVVFYHQNPNHVDAVALGTTGGNAPYKVTWSGLELGERVDLGNYSG